MSNILSKYWQGHLFWPTQPHIAPAEIAVRVDKIAAYCQELCIKIPSRAIILPNDDQFSECFHTQENFQRIEDVLRCLLITSLHIYQWLPVEVSAVGKSIVASCFGFLFNVCKELIHMHVHCVSKKIPNIFSCNSIKHYLIFIIFGKSVTERLGN